MTPHPKIAFYTLGCKLNFSESSTISRKFEDNGYLCVPFEDVADVYVINTCSVTDHADRKCKKIVRQAKKQNPEAKVAVIGCYAQLKPKEISNIDGVDVVLGAAEKFNLVEHINKLEAGTGQARIHNSPVMDINSFNHSYSLGDRTRSFLKVQDGCNYFCSFCTIPLARGKSRSDSIENIIASAKKIAASGIKEIVLTGVNIGDFSNEKGESFLDLIRELDEVVDIERIRISSIEPNLLSYEIIAFVAKSKRFVPHFHIPLQSGSNKILSLMRRRYKKELYADRVEAIKRLMPDACIGVDVITGFPSENEDDFMETYNFLNALEVSYLHVFTYSERPDTTALRIKEVVPSSVRTKRRKMLQILSEKKRRAFYEAFAGEIRKVLFENNLKDGFLSGFTDNYLKVKVPYDESLCNQIRKVKLVEPDAYTVFAAELIDNGMESMSEQLIQLHHNTKH